MRLSDFAFLRGLECEVLRRLDAAAQKKVSSKGGFIFFPGDPSDSVYFLASGRVKISRLSSDGKEFVLDLVEPGEIFGETGALDGEPREAIANLLEPSTLLSVPAPEFRRLLRASPALLMRLAESLAHRRKRLEKRLVDVAHGSASRRLSGLLLQLGGRYGVSDARGLLLRVKLSQSALGSFIGVSRELVNHAMSDLRRQGVVDLAEGHIIIRKPEALADRAR